VAAFEHLSTTSERRGYAARRGLPYADLNIMVDEARLAAVVALDNYVEHRIKQAKVSP
jgi:hypothetical protein